MQLYQVSAILIKRLHSANICIYIFAIFTTVYYISELGGALKISGIALYWIEILETEIFENSNKQKNVTMNIMKL